MGIDVIFDLVLPLVPFIVIGLGVGCVLNPHFWTMFRNAKWMDEEDKELRKGGFVPDGGEDEPWM